MPFDEEAFLKRHGIIWHQELDRGIECWRAEVEPFGTVAHILPTDALRSIHDDWNASLFVKPTLREDHWLVLFELEFVLCRYAVHSIARKYRGR